MSKFKVGDKVVLVGHSTAFLHKNTVYTVDKVGFNGDWIGLEECILNNPYHPSNFKLYVEPEQPDNTSAIVEWLDKLAYVIKTDKTVGTKLEINLRNQVVLFTDYGYIDGNQSVAEFINNRYSQLTEQANKTKREQLLKDIVSAKEAYEAKVRELELLEGK